MAYTIHLPQSLNGEEMRYHARQSQNRTAHADLNVWVSTSSEYDRHSTRKYKGMRVTSIDRSTMLQLTDRVGGKAERS